MMPGAVFAVRLLSSIGGVVMVEEGIAGGAFSMEVDDVNVSLTLHTYNLLAILFCCQRLVGLREN